MKSTYTIWIIILLTLLASLSSCDHTGKALPFIKANTVQSDSTSMNHEKFESESDDFSPGMLFGAMIAFAFMLFCLGFGIAVTVLVMIFIFGLISMGIISASLFVGLNQRSVSKGVKTFFVLISSIGFLFIGSGCFWLLNLIGHWWATTMALIYGAGLGFVAGIFVGLIGYYIVRGMVGVYTRKLVGKVSTGRGFGKKA